MRATLFGLALASLVSLSGCALDATPAGDPQLGADAELAAADTALAGPAVPAALVGAFEDGAADIRQLVRLELRADGTYSADVNISDVALCRTFPCTGPEQGIWSARPLRGGFRLVLRPTEGEVRLYTARPSVSAGLTLTTLQGVTQTLAPADEWFVAPLGPTAPWQQGAEQLSEIEQIGLWLRRQGVKADEIGVLRSTVDGGGPLLLVEAPVKNSRALAALGFRRVSAEEAYTVGPKSCGLNPWQQTELPVEEGAPEGVLVSTWAETIGAPVRAVGFVFPVEPRAVCLACGCPRGDRLVVLPAQAASAGALVPEGFADLTRAL